MGRVIFSALALLLFVPAGIVHAEIVKELRIESQPPGAKVYLPQGTRNKLLGTTPFVYKAKFHSKVSVRRLLFKKSLYKDQIVKIHAGQDKVVVSLKAAKLTVTPQKHGSTALQELQAKINPVVDKEFPKLVKNKGDLRFELTGPVSVVEETGGGVAVLYVRLRDWKKDRGKKDKSTQESLARDIWKELGPQVVIPLGRSLSGIHGVKGLALDVRYDEKQVLFGVKPSMEERVELECVPGMRQELRTVIRYVDGRQTTVLEPQTVYDPCIKRVAVKRSDLKLNPQTSVQKGQARGLFLLSLPFGKNKEVLFEQLSVFMQNTKGESAFKQGKMPSSLSGGKR